MNIELTKPEIDVVVALMDAGVKAAGLQAMRPELLAVLAKITAAVNQTAQSEADKPAD